MRLNKYINESKIVIDTEDPDEIASILRNSCSKYLHMLNSISGRMGKKMIYRGISNTKSNFMQVTPRKDRKPLDTPPIIHNYLDDLFKKKFGWKARSEGVMTSTRPRRMYGRMYYFFPADGFKFLYSNEVNDLYMDLEDRLQMIDDPYSDELLSLDTITLDDLMKPEVQKIAKKLIDTYQQNKNFKDVYSHSTEIMWKCKYYYVLSADWSTSNAVLEKL